MIYPACLIEKLGKFKIIIIIINYYLEFCEKSYEKVLGIIVQFWYVGHIIIEMKRK